MVEIVDRDAWSPRRFHAVKDGVGHAWKVTDGGIWVQGEDSVRRSKGEPSTLRRIYDRFLEIIVQVHVDTGVPQQLIAAAIANESGGKDGGERFEKHLNDWSIGVMQTLTNTAWGIAQRSPSLQISQAILDLQPVPKGGDLETWKTLLHRPEVSISLGAQYLRILNERFDCRWDPILIYAGYNAGSPRTSGSRPWGLHYHRVSLGDGRIFDAMDTFAAWYGDACDVWAIS